jgi:hypothetical protein
MRRGLRLEKSFEGATTLAATLVQGGQQQGDQRHRGPEATIPVSAGTKKRKNPALS